MPTVCDFVMHLPNEYYAPLGEFMFRCSQLEMQMHEILWRAIDIDNKQGRVLTIGAGAQTIRGMLSTVTSDALQGRWLSRNKEKIERTIIQEVDSLIGKSREYTELRNRLAHGSWQAPIDGEYENVRLLFMKQQDEKYYARSDPKINAQFLHDQCREVRSLNIKAQLLILRISEFRGIDASNFHGKRYLR